MKQPLCNWTPPLARSLLLIAAVFGYWAVAVGADTKDSADKLRPTATQELISHDNAPEELKRLIADGHVRVVYESDPDFVKAQRGWADFHVQIEHTFQLDVAKFRKNGRWWMKVTAKNIKPKIELKHLIRLPVNLKSPDIWSQSLLRHEFDHVAVSLDPRPRLLLRHLLEKLPPIEQVLDTNEEPPKATLTKLVNDELERRGQSVIELMRRNNKLLDKISVHGALPIAERAAFFTKLYTKQYLAEQQFPFIDHALALLDSKAYQTAESHLPFLHTNPNAQPAVR